MDPGGGGGLEARRLLEIAEKLLEARDLVGSKRFAERALESDPLLDGVDLTLAVIDVLLASQHRVNNQMDCYSILQLPHPSSSNSAGGGGGGNEDSLAIKRSYRRLVLLLSPDRNRSPLASLALRFVVDAYAVLSDPVKKSLLDSEIQIAASHLRSNGAAEEGAGRPVRTFWTSCPSCCHVFEYDHSYLNRFLRCRTCQQPFHATEMATKPPLVPGTDMYYCAWGFFPLGFRGGPAFGGLSNSGSVVLPDFGDGWKPFIPISPVWGNQRGGQPEKPLNAVPVNFAAANQNVDSNAGKKGNVARSTPARNKKAVAKKRVGNYSKKSFLTGVNESRNEGAEIRGARGSEAYTGTGVGISHFDIDLDATEDVLGNLHNLPYL
ncbi:uncharacterized protein LOC110026643 [Phalaenopsis equestris]|uniref:uncharacterized protein LOC110026643 n=1 Tax=Phalaenopsis equestris TaxID=78828 RepID=UPI0009E4594A|nr:uncharacterized protein LOC110026643 [Phalaenopsis equestris]